MRHCSSCNIARQCLDKQQQYKKSAEGDRPWCNGVSPHCTFMEKIMSEFTANTASREIQRLSKMCVDNNHIEQSLYDKYQVKRGLREPSGKGVLTGLTEISTVNGSKEIDGANANHI